MGALGKDRVESQGFAYNPDAKLRLILLADFSDRIVGRKAGLEGRGGHE
jgi:hypothetical protein